MSYPLRTTAAVTALGLAGAAVWAFSGSSDPGAGQEPVTLGRIANIALTTEHDCADLLSYYKTQATRMVGPYGLSGGPQLYAVTEDSAAGAAGKVAAPNAASRAAAPAPDSSTNVQVAGIDESDVVKTKGDLMVAVVNGEIRITRLAGADTKTLATWRPVEGAAQSLLLEGDTAVVLGDSNSSIPLGAAAKVAPGPDSYYSPVTDLTVLDLSDPANPRPVRTLRLDGMRSGEARLMDGELRLALTAGSTGIQWQQPEYPNKPDQDPDEAQAKFEQSEKKALAANKRLIAKSTIEDWIPRATVATLDADGKPSGSPVERPLLDCPEVAIPGSFSGLATLALVSIDLRADAPLSTWRSAGVIAEGSTVYATADHVWLATTRWEAARPNVRSSIASRFAPSGGNTQIHRFDTPPREQAKYIASGEISGTLLNQFAMDEKDGMLRVASTTDGASPAFPIDGGPAVDFSVNGDTGGAEDAAVSNDTAVSDDAAVTDDAAATDDPAVTDVAPDGTEDPARPSATKPKPSEGRVTVLKVDGDRLAQVGVVTGLGVGERIRGIRFIGDVGYVVTYRQTDPLYTVDLSDPAKPRVRGELAVLGYSAYLHPAGDGRLLGVGQDGTKDGRTTGLQLSLFDVSNLDSPRRLDRQRLAGAWSDAEGDHHAFTMAGDLVLLPYSSWTSLQTEDSGVVPPGGYQSRFDAGVIAVRVGPDGLGSASTLRPLASAPITFREAGRLPATIQRVTDATPLRTVVHGGIIYTLTQTGVAAHSSTDFDRLTFAKF